MISEEGRFSIGGMIGMDRKDLKELVDAMSLEEKALQLTQFPVHEWEGHV